MTELLDIHDLKRIFKLERSAAYQLTRRPDFPPPVRLSSTCYRWTTEQVEAFINRQIGQTPTPPPPPAAEPRIAGVTRSRRRRSGGDK